MELERNARIVAKVINFNREDLERLGREKGIAAVGTAVGNTPAIQYIASQMSEAEFEQVMRRALELVAQR